MKSKKRFATHVNILSKKFNITEENITYYSANNNLSENMTRKLLEKFRRDSKNINDELEEKDGYGL